MMVVKTLFSGSKFAVFHKIDPFRLAKMLAEKQEKERRSKIPKLSDCPNCHKHSLFYNSVDDAFECLNPKCQTSTAPH